jgi:hypothetical protein
MSPEIWFFFTPDGSAEITVLNRESARQVAQLMNSQQRQVWKVRKNRWPEAMIVADCAEIFDVQAGLSEKIEAPAPTTTTPAAAPDITPVAAPAPVGHDEAESELWGLNAISIEEKTSSDEARSNLDFGNLHMESFASEERTEIMSLETAASATQPQAARAQVVRNPAAAVKAAPVISAPAAQAQLQIQTQSALGQQKAGQKNDKRRWPRYEARLRVVVISGNRSFRSFTRNISRGGLLLEHVIPQELLERACRVIIGSTDLKENIEFDARLAGDPQNPRAVEFYEGKDFFIRKLDTWLEDLRKAPRAA